MCERQFDGCAKCSPSEGCRCGARDASGEVETLKDQQDRSRNQGRSAPLIDGATGGNASEGPRHHGGLRETVKYWKTRILTAEWEYFITSQSDSYGRREFMLGASQLRRIADHLGWDVVEDACQEAEDEFRRDCNPQHWQIFKHGTKAEWEMVQEEWWGRDR